MASGAQGGRRRARQPSADRATQTLLTSVRRPLRRPTLLAGSGLLAFLTFAHLITDALTSVLSALLPTLQERFGLTETGLAVLVATLWSSAALSQPVLGAVADRFGSRRLAAAGMLLATVLLSLITVAPSRPSLIAVLLVGGLGSAAFHPAGTALARGTADHNPGLAVGIYNAGGTAGLALGPVLILAIISAFGHTVTPWLMVPGIAVALLVYVFVPADGRSAQHRGAKTVRAGLIAGPIGALTVTTILLSIPSVTFTNTVPLWLVAVHDIARDDALIGWTLAGYHMSAAAGGVVAGAISLRVRRHVLVAGAMLTALVPLFAVLAVTPGTVGYFLAVTLAGGLLHASMVVLVVTAQDLAPDAVATASGMLPGFAVGMSGVLYVAVGRLQEILGLAPAMAVSYLLLVPGALLAGGVLARHRSQLARRTPSAAGVVCTCPPPCTCPACPLPRAT